MKKTRNKLKEKRQEILQKHGWIRDIRNVTLLSIAAIIATQAITNADLIRVMASNRMFGIQQSISPQKSLNISKTNNTFDDVNLKKLLASNTQNIASQNTLAPTLEEALSNRQNKYQFHYNTLPPINKVTIESIGIDAPIVSVFVKNTDDVMEGNFDEELKNGVAVYPGTATPGTKGHSLIFGHSSQERRKKNKYNTIFATIGKLQAGDTFTITRKGKLLTYRIKEQTITDPNKVIDTYKKRNSKDTNHLSLVTCWPLGTDRQRMVVTSELIDNKKEANSLLSYNTK